MSFSASADTGGFARGMRQMVERVHGATRRAELKAAHLVERATKKELSRYSHPAGTSTTSPPGQPPAIVTGTLRRSVQAGNLRELSPGVLTIDVGPTAVQSRIQELGGTIHARRAERLVFRVNGHLVAVERVRLPARPYLGPTVKRLVGDGSLIDIYDREWARAIGGEA